MLPCHVMSYHVMSYMSPVIMCLQPMLCHVSLRHVMLFMSHVSISWLYSFSHDHVTLCLCVWLCYVTLRVSSCHDRLYVSLCYVTLCVSSCHDCLSGYGSRCHVISHLSPLSSRISLHNRHACKVMFFGTVDGTCTWNHLAKICISMGKNTNVMFLLFECLLSS